MSKWLFCQIWWLIVAKLCAGLIGPLSAYNEIPQSHVTVFLFECCHTHACSHMHTQTNSNSFYLHHHTSLTFCSYVPWCIPFILLLLFPLQETITVGLKHFVQPALIKLCNSCMQENSLRGQGCAPCLLLLESTICVEKCGSSNWAKLHTFDKWRRVQMRLNVQWHLAEDIVLSAWHLARCKGKSPFLQVVDGHWSFTKQCLCAWDNAGRKYMVLSSAKRLKSWQWFVSFRAKRSETFNMCVTLLCFCAFRGIKCALYTV